MIRFVRNQDDAFTLVELLIVIAILAVLVSIAALSVVDVLDGALSTSMGAEKHTVQMAIDRYNSWDVVVLGAAGITANGTAARLPTGSAVFEKYLMFPGGSGKSYYCYTWGAKGVDLAVQKCSP